MDYYSSMIFLIPAVLLTFYAQMKVKSAYTKYSDVRVTTGITGLEAARRILSAHGLGYMPISQLGGNLTDNYDPRSKVLNLSQGVYGSDSVAAVGVAAHECGHAIQDAEGYKLLSIRNSIVPVVNLGSRLAWPILIIGIAFSIFQLYEIGVAIFILIVVFHLVTLPVELDASRRALAELEACGIVQTQEEIKGAKSVLSAAALTYVAALAMSVANLLRIMAMNRRR